METNKQKRHAEEVEGGGAVAKKRARTDAEPGVSAPPRAGPVEGWCFDREDWEILCGASEVLATRAEWRKQGRAGEGASAAEPYSPDAPFFFLSPKDLPLTAPEEPEAREAFLALVRKTLKWIVATGHAPNVRVCHLGDSLHEFASALDLLDALMIDEYRVRLALRQCLEHAGPRSWDNDDDLLWFLIRETRLDPAVLAKGLGHETDAQGKWYDDALPAEKQRARRTANLVDPRGVCTAAFRYVPYDEADVIEAGLVFDEGRTVDAVERLSARHWAAAMNWSSVHKHLWSHGAAERLCRSAESRRGGGVSARESLQRPVGAEKLGPRVRAQLLGMNKLPRLVGVEELGPRVRDQGLGVAELLSEIDARLGVPWRGVRLAGGFAHCMLFRPGGAPKAKRGWTDLDFFLCGAAEDRAFALEGLLECLPESAWDYLRDDERRVAGRIDPPEVLTFSNRATGLRVQIVGPEAKKSELYDILGNFDFAHVAVALAGSTSAVFHARVLEWWFEGRERGSCCQRPFPGDIPLRDYSFHCDDDARWLGRTVKARERDVCVSHGNGCKKDLVLESLHFYGLEDATVAKTPRARAVDSSERTRDVATFRGAIGRPETEKTTGETDETTAGETTEDSLVAELVSQWQYEDDRQFYMSWDYRRGISQRHLWLHSTKDRPLCLENVASALRRHSELTKYEQTYLLHYPEAAAFLESSSGRDAFYIVSVPNHPPGASEWDDEDPLKMGFPTSTSVRVRVVAADRAEGAAGEPDWPTRGRLPLMLSMMHQENGGNASEANKPLLPHVGPLRTYALSELRPY